MLAFIEEIYFSLRNYNKGFFSFPNLGEKYLKEEFKSNWAKL